MTPPGDEVPFGWQVLSTAEFLSMLVEPAVAAQLEDARAGQCPTDTITRAVVPLVDVRTLPAYTRSKLKLPTLEYSCCVRLCECACGRDP